jgi:hypothetical protein
MKITTIILASLAFMSPVVMAEVADSAAPAKAAAKTKLPRGMKRYGGIIQVPNSQKGKIVIVNAQRKLPLSNIRAEMDEFAQTLKFRVEFVDGEPTTSEKASADMEKIGADVAVFIQENPESKVTILSAPEQRWTILNASAINADARSDEFAAARIRKELMRGFLCAAGTMNSQYQGSIMAAIKEPKDLDKMLEAAPVDAIQRAIESLKVYGVTPQEMSTYKKACQEGWAPAPTNEYQKAVWDKVHAAPKNPMKIEFDPKKGR